MAVMYNYGRNAKNMHSYAPDSTPAGYTHRYVGTSSMFTPRSTVSGVESDSGTEIDVDESSFNCGESFGYFTKGQQVRHMKELNSEELYEEIRVAPAFTSYRGYRLSMRKDSQFDTPQESEVRNPRITSMASFDIEGAFSNQCSLNQSDAPVMVDNIMYKRGSTLPGNRKGGDLSILEDYTLDSTSHELSHVVDTKYQFHSSTYKGHSVSLGSLSESPVTSGNRITRQASTDDSAMFSCSDKNSSSIVAPQNTINSSSHSMDYNCYAHPVNIERDNVKCKDNIKSVSDDDNYTISADSLYEPYIDRDFFQRSSSSLEDTPRSRSRSQSLSANSLFTRSASIGSRPQCVGKEASPVVNDLNGLSKRSSRESIRESMRSQNSVKRYPSAENVKRRSASRDSYISTIYEDNRRSSHMRNQRPQSYYSQSHGIEIDHNQLSQIERNYIQRCSTSSLETSSSNSLGSSVTRLPDEEDSIIADSVDSSLYVDVGSAYSVRLHDTRKPEHIYETIDEVLTPPRNVPQAGRTLNRTVDSDATQFMDRPLHHVPVTGISRGKQKHIWRKLNKMKEQLSRVKNGGEMKTLAIM